MRTLDEMSESEKEQKAEDLMDIEEIDTLGEGEELGICLNVACRYTTRVESDSDSGYCEECSENTVASLYMIAGII